MVKVRLYFYRIWHNDKKLEIKSDDPAEILAFVGKNQKGATGGAQGSRLVPKNRLQHCIDNVSIEDIMTLKE